MRRAKAATPQKKKKIQLTFGPFIMHPNVVLENEEKEERW
jgi:hypothetical protein